MDIVLSKFTAPDFDDYFRLVSDIKVMAMITQRAIGLDEAKHDFQSLLKTNAIDLDLGLFKILDATQGSFIGYAKLEVLNMGAKEAELGYMLLPQFWGQGIGSKVTSKLIELAQQQTALTHLFAIIDPANLASRKILTKHGFMSREFKDFDGLPGEVLERDLRPIA